MKTRRKQRQRRAHAGLWAFGAVVISLGIVCVGAYNAALALVDDWCADLPTVDDATDFNLAQTSYIYANDGTTLLAELCIENRIPVTIDEVSQYVLDGTVATEDERFYEHGGYDLTGIVRAVFVNLAGGQEGASTITQQFVRNTLLADEATDITFRRKVREIELATQIEDAYSKDEILMMYLNTINYGESCYGIEAAAEHYFSCSAADLTLVQAATLIGIPNSPTMYDPVTNPDNCKERRNLVLSRMLTNGYITQDEYDAAVAEDLVLNISETDQNNGIQKYPWFTTYVREQLLEEYSADEIFRGGLTIITTLDPTMQEYAEEAVEEEYARDDMDSDQELALTCVDPDTGFIKAMIGGRDWDSDQFNIATSEEGRQAGSSFKMFTLTAAIEQGIDPWNTYVNCNGPYEYENWTVNNYGGDDYGHLSLANATAVSSNTGYARLVTAENGVSPDTIVSMAERFGLPSDTVGMGAYPSVTLGVAQVNTTEMAAAYATLAADGVYHEPQCIEKIYDKNGDIIVDNTEDTSGKQVISGEVAYAVTRVLETVITSSWGTASAAQLDNGQIAAGKTGTSEDWRDLWWCGYTPQYSCAVWCGCREEREQYTNTWAQEAWKIFMEKVLEGTENEEFTEFDDPVYNSIIIDSNDSDDFDDGEDDEEKATTDDTTTTDDTATTDDTGETTDDTGGTGETTDDTGGTGETTDDTGGTGETTDDTGGTGETTDDTGGGGDDTGGGGGETTT